jgi:hypothetical protein
VREVRRSRIRLLAIVLCFVVGACGLESHPSSSSAGAGSVLPDGFVVARNARLVGAVFDNATQKSWTAVLDIDRDPVGVYDNYVDQARRLGVPMPRSGARRLVGCKPRPNRPERTVCPEFGPPCSSSRTLLTCVGNNAGGRRAPFAVDISLEWGEKTRTAMLTVTHFNGVRDAPPLGTESRAAESVIPAPQERTPARNPGQPFGTQNDSFERGYRRFELEPGSRVIAEAPALSLAILEITGDATKMLSKYAVQLATPAIPPEVTVTRLSGRGTVLSVAYGPEAGGAAELLTDATHKYVMVTWSSD